MSNPTNQNDEDYGASASNDDVSFDYPEVKYEFLDNTADVQIHAWGSSIEESFEQVGVHWRSDRPTNVVFLPSPFHSNKASTSFHQGKWSSSIIQFLSLSLSSIHTVDWSRWTSFFTPVDQYFPKDFSYPVDLATDFLRLVSKRFDFVWAFLQVAMGMFAYMTDINRIENRDMKQIDIRLDGGDLQNLLFKFLCEWLELCGTEDYFIARKIEINVFDRKEMRIIARGYGEPFDFARHTQGTEVKAITYSNMQIHEEAPTHDVYVIVDI